MNATMRKPVRTTLFDMKQLQGQDLLGKEGLQNLIAAIRRMIGWLLSPFRTVARVLFGLGAPAVAQSGDVLTTGDVTALPGAPKAPEGLEDGGMADHLLADSAPELAGLDDGGVADQMLARGAGSIEIELQGPPEEIDVLLPMLQKHVEQLLKSHLPSDAEAAKVEGRVVALAETAEFVRYAHHIVSRQVASMVQGMAENKLYDGMSAQTILELVRAGAEGGGKPNADGSPEERLLARLALQEKLASDYTHQLQQLAVMLVRPASAALEGEEPQEVAVVGELEAVALRAGDQARAKLLLRGTPMQTTLEELPKALVQAIAAAKAGAAAPAAVEDVAESAKVSVAEPAGTEPAPSTVAVAAASPAPARQTAPVARKPAGMFGAAQVERSVAEMDEANVIDDDLPDMEGMVVG